MSLYEINSMIAALEKDKRSEDRYMTDEEMDASVERWRSMNLPDVRV